MRRFIFMLLALCLSLTASASEWTDENGTIWEFRISGSTASLYAGDYVKAISGTIPAKLVIPSTVYVSETPYTVTSIGVNAFWLCSFLTSITIPEGVTSIGNSAFYGCTGLTAVTIPSSVTSIEGYAFYKCSSLNSVTIPEGVTSINYEAFSGCSALNSVTIPEGVTSIRESAFSDCSGLTSVTIPSSVTRIYSGAFSGCPSLTSITIPSSVTSIGDSAFRGCSGLTSVTIPEGVTSIGNYAFSDCPSLTSLSVASGNTKYDSRNNCNAIIETATKTLVAGCKNTVIPSSVTRIGVSAFSGFSSLTSVTIPSSVSRIDSGAFSGCSSLTSVTIPEGVTSIGYRAFRGCSSLTSITILEGVTSIPEEAFYECSSLNSVTIPSSVTSIGQYAFYGCRGLTSVTIPEGVTSIEHHAFATCPSLTSVTVENPTPVSISPNAFTNRTNATLYVPAGSKAAYEAADYWKEFKEIVEMEPEVPTIANTAGNLQNVVSTDVTSLKITGDLNGTDINYLRTLINDHSLTSLDLADARIVEGGEAYVVDGTSYNTENDKLGDNMFADCANLESIVLPSSITSIGSFTFKGTGITSITIPESVTSIGEYAFEGCTNLKSVTMPANAINFTGRYAFGENNNIESVYISDMSAWLGITFTYGNNPLRSGAKLYLNNEEVKDLVIPDGTTILKTAAFEGCESLTSVTIPSSVTEIGMFAFSGCRGLTSITLNEGLTTIWDNAFAYCTSLTEITIPSTVENIRGHAFNGCRGLTSVTILGKPSQHFSNIAFQDCPNLTTFRCNGITLEPVDGVYQIGTAEALHDFAILSTAANCQLDACLTADIDYTAYTYGGNWYNIGMNGYAGTFDGQGHTITVNVVNPNYTWDVQSGALFNRIDEGGVVENLRVAGRIENYKFSAGIAHQIGNATISHCVTDVDLVSYATGDCTYGGIVSRTWNNGVANESNIEYCVVAGSFQGATANCRGGLVGWIHDEDRVNFSHCLFVANVDELDMTGSDTWARNMNGHATISDCYYLNTLGTTSTGTQTTSEQLASGELCWLLNGESHENPVWTQTLGQDEYPVPFRTHRIVYAEGNGYVNEYIDIATAQDLIDFATRVNAGETDLFGRLTSDIDLADMEFTPIGRVDNMYTGTFDGEGHKISNLVIDNDQERQGLFNTAGGGAVIRNLTLDATCSIKCATFAAGIVATAHGPGTLTIENCGNEATITAYRNCGGIIGGNFNVSGYGRASMVNIINCYNSGKINGTIESAGIAGWLANNCNLQNCYNIGEVTGIDGTSTFARMGNGNITINNCYETIGSQVTTVTASQVASGELCYLLNGESSENPTWTQTLGNANSYPMPNASQKVVYKDGDTYYNEIETELLMADSKARPGNTAQIVISMNNLVPITAAQFEMVVPEGTSVRDMTLTSRKDASHSIAFQQLPNGNWQGTVLSMQSVAFSGNSGAIINVSLHVDEGMSEGEYTVRLKNIELTTTDEVAINPLDCSSTLTLSNEISIGDANGDGKISVTDAVSIVNYILGNASASFHPEAADINEDGKISITDAVAVINRILNQGGSNVKGKRFPVSTLEAQ